LAKEVLKQNIKVKDSIHIACAIEAECKYYITTDDRLLNKNIDNIIITDPINFIKRVEVWRYKMKTDTLIKNEGMEILSKYLGMVEAERFIMLIQREPFDYTKWQENLFEDMTIEELAKKADEYAKNNNV
jgi:hypothetical protein